MNYAITIFIIGTLILIHELGHFLAARAVGIRVELFSVGFGPALWKKKAGGTEYRVSLVPLGGYVLPAVRDEAEYFLIPVYKRIIFSMGGPLANIIAALFLYGIYNSMTAGPSVAGIFIEPFRQTAALAYRIIASLSTLFSRPDGVSGILGIVRDGGAYLGKSAINAIRLSVILTVNLAVFNLLPLPVLDGGKITLCLMEKISVRLRKIYIPVMVAGWVLIIGLMIYATVLDAGRIFFSYS
jgi:regulator of sigma E protease